MFNRNYLAAAIACLSIHAAMPAAAEDSRCCFRVTPYYWAVGIDGKLEDKTGTNQEVNFDQSISDITDNLDFNGSLLLEYTKGHWASMGQVDYMKITNDNSDSNIPGVDVKVETDSTLATVATGYRFDMSERSTLDLMVGVRYGKLDTEAKISGGGSVNGDADVTDGIVMLRPRLAIGRNWEFSPTMSVGAGDSDLVWEMAPELVYTNECCGYEVRFGYRTVNYKFEENNVDLDFSYSGPMIGVGFAF